MILCPWMYWPGLEDVDTVRHIVQRHPRHVQRLPVHPGLLPRQQLAQHPLGHRADLTAEAIRGQAREGPEAQGGAGT